MTNAPNHDESLPPDLEAIEASLAAEGERLRTEPSTGFEDRLFEACREAVNPAPALIPFPAGNTSGPLRLAAAIAILAGASAFVVWTPGGGPGPMQPGDALSIEELREDVDDFLVFTAGWESAGAAVERERPGPASQFWAEPNEDTLLILEDTL